MSGMFSGCSAFNQPLNDWNVSKVTDMSGMFSGCTAFNQPLNDWNVSKVINMGGMFYNCTAFNSSIANWNVSKVTNMREMFRDCTAFNQPLNDWDVSNVTDMSGMFLWSTSFNQPLNDWDVSNVTDMSEMFFVCSTFNQPLNDWNVSKVTDMRSMFLTCRAFNQPLNNWNVSKVTNMSSMFENCKSFNQPLNSWDVSSVTNMSEMFEGCSDFNQPLNDWDVSKVTNMSKMFEGCNDFNQPLNSWDVSKVTDMSGMFKGCKSFNQPLGNWKLKTGIGGLDNTAMSTENYSQSLVGWAAQTKIERFINLKDEVYGLIYNDAGKTAHETLEGHGWTFYGDRYEAKGVKINAEDLSLAVNEEREIAIEKWGVAEDATVEVTVYGTNPDAIEIVKAYDGKTVTIKGKKEGDFGLKAKIEGALLWSVHSGEVKVVAVTALHVTPWRKKLNRGGSFPLLIDVRPANASEKAVTITNSDATVATYDEATGMVTATDKKGTTTITVKMAAAESTIPPVSCVVEVVDPVYEVRFDTNTEEGELSIEGKDAAALKAVDEGSKLKVLVAPKEGYKLTSLKAVGASGNETDLFAMSDYTFTVNENTTVKATFEKRKLKVTVTREGGNEECKFEVKGKGSDNLDAVEYGAKLQINTTAATSYRFKELKSDDVAIEGKMFEVKSEKDAIEVKVVFELKKFDVTTEVVAGKEEGCSIKVNGQESLTGVDYGTTVTVTVAHAEGWVLQSLTVDGVDITASKTFVVEKTVSVKATFKKEGAKTYKVTLTPTPYATLSIKNYDTEALNAVAENTELEVEVTGITDGYELKELKANGVDITETKKFTVTEAVTVKAVFTKNGGSNPGGGTTTFAVTLAQEGEGTLAIEGYNDEALKAVVAGTELTVIATPKEGYTLTSLTAGSQDILAEKKFTVTEAVTVKAVFKTIEEAPKVAISLAKEGEGTLAIEGYNDEALKAVAVGTELTVIATPKEGYTLTSLTAGTQDILATKKFTVTGAVTVKAVFKKNGNNGGGNNGGGNGGGSWQPQTPQAVEDVVLASLSVMPNPFSSQLRIDNPEGIAARYELVNASGVVVRFGAFSATEVLVDTEALPAGLYLVRITAQNGAKRMVKVSKY